MAREYTTKIEEMADEGVISWETIAREALCRMSEDQVEDMCVECDWITPDDFEDEEEDGWDGEGDDETDPDDGGAIEIDITIGYGMEAAAVPADLIEAVRRLAAHFYDSRGLPANGAAALPSDVAALLAPHRVVSL